MRAVIQRVESAAVRVDGKVVSEIGKGLLVLLGVSNDDEKTDADYLARKISELRIFEDSEERMNLSVQDVNGSVLVVSQFTLYGDIRRGRRPSWADAASPEIAEPLYLEFVESIRRIVGLVEVGVFGAMMKVELVNDGPVTILAESRKAF